MSLNSAYVREKKRTWWKWASLNFVFKSLQDSDVSSCVVLFVSFLFQERARWGGETENQNFRSIWQICRTNKRDRCQPFSGNDFCKNAFLSIFKLIVTRSDLPQFDWLEQGSVKMLVLVQNAVCAMKRKMKRTVIRWMWETSRSKTEIEGIHYR